MFVQYSEILFQKSAWSENDKKVKIKLLRESLIYNYRGILLSELGEGESYKNTICLENQLSESLRD